MQGYLGTPITRRAGGRLGAPPINSGGLGVATVEVTPDREAGSISTVEGYLGKRPRSRIRSLGHPATGGTGVLGRVPSNYGFAVWFADGSHARPNDGPCPAGFVYASDLGCIPASGGESNPEIAPPVDGCVFGCPTRVHQGCYFDGQTQRGNPYCSCCCVYDCGGEGFIADVTIETP